MKGGGEEEEEEEEGSAVGEVSGGHGGSPREVVGQSGQGGAIACAGQEG